MCTDHGKRDLCAYVCIDVQIAFSAILICNKVYAKLSRCHGIKYGPQIHLRCDRPAHQQSEVSNHPLPYLY